MMPSSPIRKACTERRSIELASIRNERSAGTKTAGCTCHAFPAAVLAGLGLRPVRVLCGVSSDAESDGEKVVRPDVCPLVKTLLGNVGEQRGLHGDIDLWIGLSTCDAMRRGMDMLAGALGREVHPVQLPATRTEASADYYADQVLRVVADIGAHHGLSFDLSRAGAWQREQDAAAAVLARAARSGRVSPLDLHEMFHLFFLARPRGLADFFEGLLTTAPVHRGKRTILLTGSPLAYEDTVLLEDLESRGYSVLPLNCTGLNAVEDGAGDGDGGNVVRSMALRSFHRPICARSRPNRSVYDRIAETIREARPAGLVVKCLKSCDHWYTERERMRRTFDLPVLVFDSDYADGGRERLLSRIDAFVEMME